MKIIIAKDYNDMSRKAANYLSAQIIMKPNAVIGLATGETPIGTYNQLVDWYEKEILISQKQEQLILMNIKDCL